jgi:3-dehydroquinate synthetase
VRFILPTAIGKVIITDEVTTEILQNILQES